MNLFEAFNVEEPEAVTVKELKKNKKDKKSTSTTSNFNGKPKEAKSKLEVTHETKIRYGGLNHPITVYFSDEEIEEGILGEKDGKECRRPISENDIRHRMEMGDIKLSVDELADYYLEHIGPYAELISALTVMHYEKDKDMVIPVLQARKKGCSKDTSSGVPNLPKIPYSLIMKFWKVSRYYGQHYGTEVHADIYWHPVEKQYHIDFPKQKVHKYWAEVTEVNPLLVCEMKKIMEIHSHHTMCPIPSMQDDESEIAPNLLYCIVGGMKQTHTCQDGMTFHLGELYPSVTMRTYKDGQHIPLNVFQFIELPFLMDEPLPQVKVVAGHE